MTAHSADWSRSRIADVAAPALAAAVAVSPDSSATATGNGDDLTKTTACNSQATATGADDVKSNAPSVSVAYVYGYDSAGNPTLTDIGYHGILDGKLPG